MIRRPREIAALRAPLAAQIVTAVEALGAFSVTDLAERLGRKAESLYYHVHRLHKAGLLVITGHRPAGRRQETVYELAGRGLEMDTQQRSPAFLKALERLYSAALRATERDLTAALRREKAVKQGPRTLTAVRYRTARLDPEAVRQVRRMLEELDAFLASHDHPQRGEQYAVTTVLAAGKPD